ncbi:unnamed protein product, partial [Mesorhabditis belari]|uniref:Innexin n=1 Tax=Mesorhabditis belari TaxID=2138241 RepID=A0AAF3ESE8_9BILA
MIGSQTRRFVLIARNSRRRPHRTHYTQITRCRLALGKSSVERVLSVPSGPSPILLPVSSFNSTRSSTVSLNQSQKRLGFSTHSVPYPQEIVRFLDKHVIGQEEAKRVLAVGVYQHYLRLLHNLEVEEAKLIRELAREAENQKLRQALDRKTLFRIKDGQAYFDEDPGEPDFRSRRDRLVDDLAVGRERMSAMKGINETEFAIEKSNILLGGPSGSGKTYLTQRLAEILNVPMALCDCTTLTQAGYVGDDVESVIQRLLQNANGDVERAEMGIVFLDEIDKINTSADQLHSTGNRDVSGRGVQTGLLKLVEGHVVKVKNPLNPTQKVNVNTTNILFIGSGAFSGLENVVARRLEQRSLGFGSSSKGILLEEKNEDTLASQKDELTRKVDQGDLINYGLIPEFVGRFPVFVPFHSINRVLMKRILLEPKNNLIAQAQRLFSLDGITLNFTQCAVQAIADEATGRKTGARALRSILERVLLEAKFQVPGSNVQRIVFDGASVRGEKKPFLNVTFEWYTWPLFSFKMFVTIPFVDRFLNLEANLIHRMKTSDFVDRLHNVATPWLLAFFVILVGTKMRFGDPINCMFPPEIDDVSAWQPYFNQFCFVTNTYKYNSIESADGDYYINHQFASTVNYYQWVPFLLAAQMVAFCLPAIFSQIFIQKSALMFENVIKFAKNYGKVIGDPKKAPIQLEAIGACLISTYFYKQNKQVFFTRSIATFGYIIYKILCIINIIIQMGVIAYFLGIDNWQMGFTQIKATLDVDLLKNPGFGLFPRTVVCHAEKSVSGGQEYEDQPFQYDFECILPINYINEKLFLFIWCWYMMMLCLTICNLFGWLIFLSMPDFGGKHLYIKSGKRVDISQRPIYKQFFSGLGVDGRLLFAFISTHAGDLVVVNIIEEILKQLAAKRLEAEKKKEEDENEKEDIHLKAQKKNWNGPDVISLHPDDTNDEMPLFFKNTPRHSPSLNLNVLRPTPPRPLPSAPKNIR